MHSKMIYLPINISLSSSIKPLSVYCKLTVNTYQELCQEDPSKCLFVQLPAAQSIPKTAASHKYD